MKYRLPYYMAYPMPFEYDDEKIESNDFDYMKSMYPETAKKLLPYVEDECDRMEYEGSMVYDEYPDQLQIRLMCRRVYEKVAALGIDAYEEANLVEAQQTRYPYSYPHSASRDRNNWTQDMIHLMLFNELFKRRGEHRRRRRRYF